MVDVGNITDLRPASVEPGQHRGGEKVQPPEIDGRSSLGPFYLLLVVFLGLLAFGFWSATARIDEIARARGQVLSLAGTQVIQSADSGVLRELLVSEGERVRRGQTLVILDQTRAEAAYKDSLNKVAALEATLSRLVAEVYERPIHFAEDLAAWPEFRANQTALFHRRQQALVEGIAALEKTASLVEDELRITEPLQSAGDVGEAEVLRLKRQISEIRGQIINNRNQYFQDAQAEMTRAEEELAAQRQLLRERQTLLEQTEISAPVDAVVKRIDITTVGASVRPGEVLMELLPTGSELIVEAKYPPADVASLRLGMPTTVKLDAYDPSIYGSLEGVVTYISPDALTEQDPRAGETVFYRVRVSFRESAVDRNAERAIIINPGMTAMVEVRTRDRTIFSYLTKPITKTFSEAFTER
ncbi:HlyD family efflux transporter periplasmic adaptor subunit [Parvibaculum lavamentivorans]|nr:HlyD family efflux transporter periplasmic adaptor subunit [Parvibaculum lavamentivorans]